MRPLNLLLLLAALAAAPSLAVEVTSDAGGRQEHAAAPEQHVLGTPGLMVEPVDADAAGPTLVSPGAPAHRRNAGGPPRIRRLPVAGAGATAPTPRRHLLDRIANPSTAPPSSHA